MVTQVDLKTIVKMEEEDEEEGMYDPWNEGMRDFGSLLLTVGMILIEFVTVVAFTHP